MGDFAERFRILRDLLNDAVVIEKVSFTTSQICQVANITDTVRLARIVDGRVYVPEEEIPAIWAEQLADSFGVNREWMESGKGRYPFKSNLAYRFSTYDAMNILRWEYLSDIEEFVVAFGMVEGLLHTMIIRHRNKFCYEVYPQLYPFFSKVGETGKNEILEFYRFLKYASRIGKLSDKAYFIANEGVIRYYKGEIAPLKIITEPSAHEILNSVFNLSDHIDTDLLSQEAVSDLLCVLKRIRNNIDNVEEINGENDWNIIIRKNPYLAESDEKLFKLYVKEVEKTDDLLTGIETDIGDEEDEEDEEEPYDVNSIVINTKTITAFQIEHWIKKDMLDLSPEYQRNLVWDQKRKSSLIESMMLNIPIPAFYLDEREDGVKTVVDGMQRLSTIHDFFSGEFKLTGLQYLYMYNGLKYDELNSKYRSRLEDTQLTMNILDAKCPEDVKFDVFCRVNTGGMPLNAQEVRNALSTRETRQLLKTMSNDEAFMRATLSRISDVRMGVQEICLRYICISDHFDWGNMRLLRFKGLKKSMDAMVIELNREDELKKENRLKEFHTIMDQCAILLGSRSFSRQADPFKINKSILTAWAVCLKNLKLDERFILDNVARIREDYNRLLEEDLEFQEAVSKSTTQRKSIEYTIIQIKELIEGNG